MKAIFFIALVSFCVAFTLFAIWTQWLKWHPRISSMRSLSQREEEILSLAKEALSIDPKSVRFSINATLDDYWFHIDLNKKKADVTIVDTRYEISWDLWLRLRDLYEEHLFDHQKDQILDSLLKKVSDKASTAHLSKREKQ